MVYDDANLVMQYLWLGNREAAHNEAFIKDTNIKLVINCSKDIPIPDFYGKYGIKVIRLPINDANTQDDNARLEASINDIVDVIHEYRRNNMNVLVHCYAGMQRSATVVASYMIKKYNHRPEHAIFYTRHKRPIAFTPKPTFGDFLKNQKH